MVPLSRHLVDTTLNQVSLCYYISGSEKRIGASKGATHPEAERIAMKEVKTRWESGNPVTRPEVYNLLRKSYEPFITTTVSGGYEFQCDGTSHKMSLSVSGKT